MYYITIQTNSLVALTGRNTSGLIDWGKMGTNANLINLTQYKLCKFDLMTNTNIYILPIDNLKNATQFKQHCLDKYNIEVSIIDEISAKELIESYA